MCAGAAPYFYAAAPAEDQPAVPLVISLATAAGESASAPATDQQVVPFANSVGIVIESIVGGVPVTYTDEKDYYDGPESLEDKDWARGNHCVGCDYIANSHLGKHWMRIAALRTNMAKTIAANSRTMILL